MFYLSIIIVMNIFTKVSTQYNSEHTNNSNTLCNNNGNQKSYLNNRETEYNQMNLSATNQSVANQNHVRLKSTLQPHEVQAQSQYELGSQTLQCKIIKEPIIISDNAQFSHSERLNDQKQQQDTSKQFYFNNNKKQEISSFYNKAPQKRSARQKQYYFNEDNQDQSSEESQESSNEQQSDEDYNVKRSGPRGRALGHQKNGKNRNNNSLNRGNSLNAKLKNINKHLAKYNEQLTDNIEPYQYQYSQGWSKNEKINRNEIVKPHVEYHKNFKHSTPNAPEAEYYQKFFNIYNDVENQRRTNDFSANEMESINDDFNGRSIVAPGQYPHMAAIGFLSNEEVIEFKCGGSLISESFVITAAHCCSLSGEAPLIVKLGIINLKNQTGNTEPQRRAIKEIIVHPSYNALTNYHDIALLKLQSPVEFSTFVRPILLWANHNIPYEKAFTMGYGSTSFAKAPTNILTELSLSLIPLQNCKQILPRDEKTPYGILDTQLCGHDLERNRDTCQGDSGGPLQLNFKPRNKHNFYRYYLVGIISYGEFCGSQNPGVYTRVSSYCLWIASIVWPEYFQGFQ